MSRVDEEQVETHGQFSLPLLMDNGPDSSYNCLEKEDTRKKMASRIPFWLGFPSYFHQRLLPSPAKAGFKRQTSQGKTSIGMDTRHLCSALSNLAHE